MEIDFNTARYISAVAEAIEGGRRDLTHMTNICPECNVALAPFQTDGHIVVNAKPPTSVEYGVPITLFVVVGCEGYWVIDPNQVGIPSPNWQNWAELADDITPDDFKS